MKIFLKFFCVFIEFVALCSAFYFAESGDVARTVLNCSMFIAMTIQSFHLSTEEYK